MDISAIKGISLSPEGIWQAPYIEDISYTANGHELISPSEESSFWFDHRLKVINSLVDKVVVTELMDVGGGNGRISKFLQDKEVDVTLIEPGLTGARIAKKSGVINASFDTLSVPNGMVQSIGIFDVLEHVEDDVSFLRKIQEALKPDGLLILTVPALQALYSDFDREVGHFRRYTLKQLVEKLNNSGFNIVYKSYLFLPLPFFIWPLRKVYQSIGSANERRKFGHVNKTGILGKVINLYLSIERFLVSKSIKIPFGSTCLIVASK